MEQFENEQFDNSVDINNYPRKVPLNDDVFIRVGLKFDPNEIRVKTDQCVATSMPSPADINWRPLIQSGCPRDSVRLLSTADSNDVKFAFKAFDFRHNSSGFVYIHCEVSVCEINDASCRMGCVVRDKRAAGSSRHKSHLVSLGPLYVDRTKQDPKEMPTMPTVFAAVCLLVAMAAMIVAVIGWTRTSRNNPAAI